MSDYTRIYDFSAKDALATGNPAKLIKGSEVDDEFDALVTHTATKYDSSDIATQVQAEAGSLNTVLMTPLRVQQWADDHAGAVGDLQALADPGADRIPFWDDSASAVVWGTVGTGLSLSGTTLSSDDSAIDHDSLSGFVADEHIDWTSASDNFNTSGSVTAGSLVVGGGQTISDSDNIPLLDANNVFTNSYRQIRTTPTMVLEESDAPANEQDWYWYVSGEEFRAAVFDDAGSANENWLKVNRSGATVTAVDFPNGELQYGGVEVGYRGTPVNTQNGNYTLVAADAGKTIYKASGGSGETYTIPANGSVAFAVGTVVTFVNQGGGDLSIAITTDTLTQAGTGNTGARTLADDGMATAVKVTSTSWVISGTGLS